MTSDKTRSLHSLEEIFDAVRLGSEVEDAPQLRLLLYSTARNFNHDIWQKNNTKLIYSHNNPHEIFYSTLKKQAQESLFLLHRLNLEIAHVAEILGIKRDQINKITADCEKLIDEQFQLHPNKYIENLEYFPLPALDSEKIKTKALSQIIKDVKSIDKKLLPRVDLVFWCLFIGCLAALGIYLAF